MTLFPALTAMDLPRLFDLRRGALVLSGALFLSAPVALQEPGTGTRGVLVEESDEDLARDSLGAGERYALVIGINDYEDDGFEDLDFAEADARLFRDTLVGHGFFPDDEDHVRLLTGTEADRNGITDGLSWLIDSAGENDFVVIFFAGHGAREGERASWVAHDSSASNPVRTGLRSSILSADIGEIRARKVLIVIDACHAAATTEGVTTRGSDDEESRKIVEQLGEKFLGTGRATLASSTDSQLSAEDASLGHGVFTHFIVEAMQGGADKDEDGVVTLDEIKNHVYQHVTNGLSGGRALQEPVFKVEDGLDTGSFLVSVDIERLREIQGEKRREAEAKDSRHLLLRLAEMFLDFELTTPQIGQARRVLSRPSGELSEDDRILRQIYTDIATGVVPVQYLPRLLDQAEAGELSGPTTDPGLESRDEARLEAGGVKLIRVAAGDYAIGSPVEEEGRSENENRHAISFSSDYWIGEVEVTQGQWSQLMDARPWEGQSCAVDGDELPVTYVSWNDAMLYCQRLTEKARSAQELPEGFAFSLPTEAEWEVACRGGAETAYHFGDSADSMDFYGITPSNRRFDRPERVRSRRPNELGLYDTVGNVWEWCADRVVPNTQASNSRDSGAIDPMSDVGTDRAVRGGGWNSSPRYCRSASRYSYSPSSGDANVGFRVVLVREEAEARRRAR